MSWAPKTHEAQLRSTELGSRVPSSFRMLGVGCWTSSVTCLLLNFSAINCQGLFHQAQLLETIKNLIEHPQKHIQGEILTHMSTDLFPDDNGNISFIDQAPASSTTFTGLWLPAAACPSAQTVNPGDPTWNQQNQSKIHDLRVITTHQGSVCFKYTLNTSN